MSNNTAYILPEDVKVIPVKELHTVAKDKFEYEDDDFVLTYSNARQTSKVIDSASAALLKEFRTPRTMIEGIYKYSILNQLNPSEVLDESYQFLFSLRDEGFLVDIEKKSEKAKEDILKPGEQFNGYEVVKKIHGISDTEVYQLKKDNTLYAVKVMRTSEKSHMLSYSFSNELDILRHLDGKINPALVEKSKHHGNDYMVIEWCEGNCCDVETEKLRNLRNNDNLIKLLQISTAILDAYTHLHSQNIVHGDIHPRNIMVDEAGGIKIIDYGWASHASTNANVPRGGVSFYYDPEFAAASLGGKQIPPATFASEQYSLGALLYLFFTGKTYIDFSLERELLMAQVVNSPTVPFSQYDIDIHPGIEQAIGKALSKQPADRFASVDDFKQALLQVLQQLTAVNAANHLQNQLSFAAFNTSIKNRLGFDGNFIETGLCVAPVRSVYFGAAGIAYMYYRMALIESNPQLMATADVWINRANNFIGDEDCSFYSKELDLTTDTVGNISIYHTASGIHLVQALISRHTGDYSGHAKAIMNFIEASSKPCDNLDLTLGKSSVLIGGAIIWENLCQDVDILRDIVKVHGDKIMLEIWQQVDTYSPIVTDSTISYRGIAHGWAGILYATLRWCSQSGTVLPATFYNRVQELIDITIDEGQSYKWAIASGQTGAWPGWCHGTTGYTFLWALLYQTAGDQKFLDIATKAANHFYSVDKNGQNACLCCGTPGEAYAMLNLHNLTGEKDYLTKAKHLAKVTLNNVYRKEMHNNSLYKGDVGAAILFTELASPRKALMPLFQ